MRLYHALLWLYPASFRAEYRDEMCEAHARRMREVRGPLAPLVRACAALADVVPNALAAHADLLGQDLRYAARSLRRAPGFALTVVMVVALGVGANTAVFSVADFVFIRPLPFPEPERVVKIWQRTPGDGRNEVSPANYSDWRELTTSFSGLAAYTLRTQNLVSRGEPRELQAALATPELFPLLRVPPLIGRTFTPRDRDQGPFVVLSEGLWRSQFGGDPGVLGTSVRLGDVPHTVLGVMPAAFQFPYPSVEAWASFDLRESDFVDRADTYLEVVARLRPDVPRARAEQDLALVSARLEQAHPEENKQVAAWMLALRDELPRSSRMLVVTLCGAALCILLLACANLASLFLARGAYRSHELAVRAALGAGRERLVRQLVTETVGLTLVGGLVGVAAAAGLVPLLARLVPSTLPAGSQPALDLRVLAFAAVLMVVTGFALGLLPALRASRVSALEALGSGARTTGGRTQRLRAALVVIEVASSVVLLITSGLLIRAVWRLQAVDPGFVSERVLTLRTALPLGRYLMTERRAQYYAGVLERVRAAPGVRSAAFTTGLPLSRRGGIWPATASPADDPHDEANEVSLRFITPQYFATLGIPMRQGRDVAESDTRKQPNVAVVSESFTKRHWRGDDPIGKRFKVAGDERTIVGVVGDVRVRGLEVASEPQVYLPYQQVADSSLIGYMPSDLAVRMSSGNDATPLVPWIRRAVRAADVEQPIAHVRMLADVVAQETAPRLAQLGLLVTMSLLALLIAGLGVHGLLTFTVSMRSRELGIRRALGAPAAHVIGLVLGEGLGLALIGVTVGAGVGYGMARGMSGLLVGVQPGDPLTIAGAMFLCLVTAAVGCLRPTLEAARVDPLLVIRAE